MLSSSGIKDNPAKGVTTMPRETISGLHDCAKALSMKQGCSIAVAQSTMTDVLDVIEGEIMRLGGVQFVDRFTIKKQFKQERRGLNPATKEPIIIRGRYTLRLTVGKALFEKLNPQREAPTTVTATIPFKLVGRFKPGVKTKRPQNIRDNF